MILSLNLIVPVDEMGALEPVGRLTFEINDDEVCVKNCESESNCSAIQNPWFRKSKIRRGVMGKQTC